MQIISDYHVFETEYKKYISKNSYVSEFEFLDSRIEDIKAGKFLRLITDFAITKHKNLKEFEEFKLQTKELNDKLSLINETSQTKLSAVEKTIFLNELGIIDFLKEKHKGISDSELGKLLSFITDIKQSTSITNIQGLNENTPNKNPYRSEKTVTKIKKLINSLIAFNQK